jgi:predicted RNA-binding Zn-ribbon protein involved in translation (DUF1610 family)
MEKVKSNAEVICKSCDCVLEDSDIQKDNCPKCGNPLEIQRNVTVQVIAFPPLFGDTM